MKFEVRQAVAKDFPAIYQLVQKSFEGVAYSDGQEHLLVERLWASSSYLPDLSLVAEIEGQIVGYILFTEVKIGRHVELALAPLVVAPTYQCQGIGKALIEVGHRQARKLGYHLVGVLGSDRYYSKHGYIPAFEKGILPPFDLPKSYYMIFELVKACDRVGVVHYPKEFGLDR